MRRLVLLFDGTWNTLNVPAEVTNVVRVGQALVPVTADGTTQIVYYNSGVGSGGFIDRILGGVFGAGVKSNVKRGLTFLSFNYDSGESDGRPDEIYIFGFSRGAYTARALAGVIGAIGGIPYVSSFAEVEKFWTHYKKGEKARLRDGKINDIYQPHSNGKLIKCVAVWDTVGSYGIPTGIGLGGLGRWFTSWTRNFRDNTIGRRIEYGFHAMAIDERRRAFSPTAWVPRKPKDPKKVEKDAPPQQPLPEPVVEQVWFAGAHANVGGGYTQTGLSDHALIWMMARVQEQTGLEFDGDYIRKNFWPCSACSLYRSNRGWWLSSLWPAIRSIPKRVLATRGVVVSGQGEILDGRVHWTVRDRLGKRSLVDKDNYGVYAPKNLVDPIEYTKPSAQERDLINLCRTYKGDEEKANQNRRNCALRCDLTKLDGSWWRGRGRARRMRALRDAWKDVPEVPA